MSPEPTPAALLPPQRETGRRIVSIVLPELLCEAATRRSPWAQQNSGPLGVVFVPSAGSSSELPARDRLAAVNFRAAQLGARAGQTLTEARAELGSLRIEFVTQKSVELVLASIADVARGLGSSVSYDQKASPPDTVWLDVTGTAHSLGGEEALALELRERVRLLGHSSRIVVAPGPVIGRALGLWGPVGSHGVLTVSEREASAVLTALPLIALPELAPRAAWFSTLGILTWGQLRELPLASLAARLGPQTEEILELVGGRDRTPLVPIDGPRVLLESQGWEEPTSELAALLFSLGGLLGRLSARLQARGEATSRLRLQLVLENSRNLRLDFELPSPAWRESDMERVLRSRLERLVLRAPVLGLALRASGLAARQQRQLDWAASASEPRQATELPLLLSELEAEVGPNHVGFLMTVSCQRPEGRSSLVSFKAARKRRAKAADATGAAPPEPGEELDRVTRSFARPVALSVPLRVGSQFALGRQLYTIARLRRAERPAGGERRATRATHRDYVWAWLESDRGATEALLYVDRRTGVRFLQALAD